ncbi:MAG: hypothetical protein ACSNEK_07075 [Parachlamydiaceae bacterium]
MSAIQPGPRPDWESAKAIKAGASPTLTPIDKDNQIPDDQEPITFLKNAIAKATGKEVKDCKDLKIKGSFRKLDDNDRTIQLMAYRNPPHNLKAPSCFYLERVWTVTVQDKDGSEKTFTFKKNVYTNVVIPTNYDTNLLHDKQVMATIAARAYSNAVESAIQVAAGQNPKYDLTQDQITKLQRDNFLIMGLYHGKKQVAPNKLKQVSTKTRTITHVKLKFRAGKKDVKDEQSDDSTRVIDLFSARAGKPAKGEAKYLLVTDQDPDVHPEVKRVSTFQKLLHENPDLDEEEIIERLDIEGVNEADAKKALKSELDRMQSDFLNDLASFTDAAAVDHVRNAAKPGTTAVSDELKALLPSIPNRNVLKKLFGKKEAPPEHLAVLTTLLGLRQAGQQSPALNKEIEELIDSYQTLYGKMNEADIKMRKKENLLAELAISDIQIDEIDQQARLRRQSLALIGEQFQDHPAAITSNDSESSEDSLSSIDSSDDTDDLSEAEDFSEIDSDEERLGNGV